MTARIPSASSAIRRDCAWLSVLKLATDLIGGGGGGPLHPAHAHRKLYDGDGRAPDTNFRAAKGRAYGVYVRSTLLVSLACTVTVAVRVPNFSCQASIV